MSMLTSANLIICQVDRKKAQLAELHKMAELLQLKATLAKLEKQKVTYLAIPGASF